VRQGTNGRSILKWKKEKKYLDVNWIGFQDKVECGVL
jgi:hypothetical protein